MFGIAVHGGWLSRLAPDVRSRLARALGQAVALRSVVIVDAPEELQRSIAAVSDKITFADGAKSKLALQASPQASWIFVGATFSGPGIIPLVIGKESREPGVAWTGTANGVELLCAVGRGSGLEMALAPSSAEQLSKQLAHRFKSQLDALQRHRSAYVFGAKRLGTLVGAGLKSLGHSVAAYLDNNPAAWGRHEDGAAIQGIDAKLDRNLPVIIGTTRFPFTLSQQLAKAGFTQVIPYPLMTLVDATAFPDEIPYIGTYQDIAAHREKYLSEYLNYGDDRSREVLDALLRYRLTLDSTVVQSHFEPESEQYFDPDLARFTQSEVWVDAGGFDGQTTLNFMSRVGGRYGRVYYFEPDAALMARSRQAMHDRDNVVFCEAGAFSRNGVTSFNTTGTTNGSINPAAGASGDITIAVSRIDDVLKEPATFIKMDIEGAEPEALKGAKEQIARHAPRLAIAAYHRGEDIWQLAELIRDLNPSYQLGLRHYTEGDWKPSSMRIGQAGLKKEVRYPRQSRGL